MKHGKKYIESAKSFDNQKLYDPEEGISVVLSTAKAKFDETIEAHIRLGVDSRHADQQVRGAVVLPHGTGKVVRVLVFAKGDKAREAQEAGADFVGDEDMVKKIQTENCNSRYDGRCRSNRPRSRPEGLDAQPQERHRHHGCCKGNHRYQSR